MKTHAPHTTLRRTAALFVIAVIAGFATANEARSATYYTGTNNTNAWSAARWSTSTNGPFTSAWAASSDVVFLSGNDYNFGGIVGGFAVGNITVQSNATVKFTNNAGTMGGGGNVRTVTVETNSVLDLVSQSMSTGAGNGWIKEGSGVWAMGGGTNLNGSFVLNGGTMVMRGINAMGGGTTSTLILNNGTVAANANRDVSAGKYGGGMSIAGDIQFGALSNAYAANAQYLINDTANISFGDDVSLGGATRTLTIGGNGNYTFSGVLSSGGLIVTNATDATGRLILSGANTYSGGTLISGGTLQIGANGTTGSVIGDITNNARLSVSRSDNITWTNAITGIGSFEQAGSGVLTFTNDNT